VPLFGEIVDFELPLVPLLRRFVCVLGDHFYN
jgi:hypothetical protein